MTFSAALVLSAAVLWALIGPLAKFVFAEGVSGLEVAFWRSLIGASGFLVHGLIAGMWVGKWRIERKDILPLLAFGVLAVGLLEGSNLLTVEKGGAAFASILLYSAPVWVALMSWFFFKEPMPRSKLLALAIALIGVTGVALNGSSEVRFNAEAVLWGLVSGWSYALFYVFGKAYLKKYEPQTIYMYVFPVGSLAIAPFVEFQADKSPTAWAILVFLGLASTWLAYFLYSLGLKKLEPTRAAVIATVEPVASGALAFALWDERFGAWGYFWAIWVFVGIWMMMRERQDN